LVNEQGTVVERHSYDAWGRERNATNWSSYTVATGRLDRGYTTHEHLREFGLINMNGRVYDPILGRMLSPDNYVQDPFNSQNYNRYGYCYNNPLKYTDPSGDFLFIYPDFGFSRNGGFNFSITIGIGIPDIFSFQFTIGGGNGGFQASVGVSVGGSNAYIGYGAKGGFMAGVGFSIFSLPNGLPSGFNSNITNFGINYSEKGGESFDIFGVQVSEGGLIFDPSIG